jgi:thioesterase domain-containing protein/acyl carrier protein
MVPAKFFSLERLPLTANGKIDHKALLSLSTAQEGHALQEQLPGPVTARLGSNNTADQKTLEGGEGASVKGSDAEARHAELESKLLQIWQAVLGRTALGAEDNFFDLGGNSLLAMVVQSRVEKETGKRLPLATFFKAATVRDLAQLLSEPSTSSHGVYFPGCRATNDKPHLFCLHHLSAAQSLAKHLSPHWPVYGIELPLADKLRQWYAAGQLDLTLEELAARTLAIIQRVQPTGPYYLAGFCFGGVLAFEVARQLQSQDEDVALLALLDARYRPGLKPLRFPRLRRWAHHAGNLRSEGVGYLLKELRTRSEVDQRRRAALRALENGDRKTNRAELKEVRLLQGEFLSQLLTAYKGKPYAGNAFLLRALRGPRSLMFDLGQTSGWDKVIEGRLQVEDIECTHDELAEEPWVGQVARILAPRLR